MVDLIVEDGTGLPNANTYATLWEADAYFDGPRGLHAENWAEAEDYKRMTALVWATTLLDRHTAWMGSPSTTTQALRWPRMGVWNQDGNTQIGSNSVPAWLKAATAELARLLLERDRPVDAELSRTSATSSLGRSRAMGLPDGKFKAVIPPAVSAITAPYAIRGVSFLVRAA